MSKSKSTTSIRIDETLFSKLKIIATKEKRSINSQMEHAIEKCVENFEKEYGTISVDSEPEQ